MSEVEALLNEARREKAKGKDANAAVTAAMSMCLEAAEKGDSGRDYVESLDEEGLADFLNADEEEPQYGREAVSEDAGESEMSLVSEDEEDDWATY